MAISKKRARRVKNPRTQKAIDRIYDDLNEVIGAVNQGVGDAESLGKGKSGDIRVAKNSDQTVSIEVRTDEGWFGLSGFEMLKSRSVK